MEETRERMEGWGERVGEITVYGRFEEENDDDCKEEEEEEEEEEEKDGNGNLRRE